MILAATVDAALLQPSQVLSYVSEGTSYNSERQMRVDEIVEARQKDTQSPKSDEYASDGGCSPVNF
jgi:hypothetical protein